MAGDHNDPFHHVRDSQVFEFPFGNVIELPTFNLLGYEFHLTKFMVLEVVAAVLTFVIFAGLARKIRNGEPVRGKFWNFWETLALFIRDEVVRPAIGVPHEHHDDHGGHVADGHGHAAPGGHVEHVPHSAALAGAHHTAVIDVSHPADRFLPFIWTLFFFVLFCNLLGAIPFMGSATADTSLTGVLALAVLVMVVVAGVQRSGVKGYLKSIAPSMDLPGPMGYVIIPLVWGIELFGLLIKHFVLAVRLFANMLAGHTVLGVILGFIAVSSHHGAVWYLVTPASIFGQLFIGLLELFVAFLQAYVFAFLASLFIGASVNPH